MKYRIARLLLVLTGLLVVITGCLAGAIYAAADDDAGVRADAAVVLGAAVWSNEPSPVFKERINHAVKLYRQGRVRKIILTGGQGSRNEPAESIAARAYASRRGVPQSDMLVETESHTTFENLVNAQRVANANRLETVLVVSDPFHMKRAMSIAHDIGLKAHGSPTHTTRYRTAGARFNQLVRETWFYAGYLVGRSLGRIV